VRRRRGTKTKGERITRRAETEPIVLVVVLGRTERQFEDEDDDEDEYDTFVTMSTLRSLG